ncbi:MAG: ABC transporter substrate-binding protein [Candidatus Sumerlaeia bacterium]
MYRLKRTIAVLCLLLALMTVCTGRPIFAQDDPPADAESPPTLRVSGPWMGLVSLPFFRMMEELEAQESPQYKIEYTPWKNTSQLRAMVASEGVDFIATHSHIAANFHNRDVSIRLLNVSLWGIFWIVGDTHDDLASLRGKEIIIPLKKGELPDIIFRKVVSGLGYDPDKDFQIRYVGMGMEAVQRLIMGKAQYAVLPEPIGSIALFRSQQLRKDNSALPELHRGTDLQKEWGSAYNREPRIAVAGVAATGKVLQDEALLVWFHANYARAVEWCKAHPEEAGALAHKYYEQYPAKPIAESIRLSDYRAIPAGECREDLDFYFQAIMESDPEKLGGKMPPDAFYWSPEKPE